MHTIAHKSLSIMLKLPKLGLVLCCASCAPCVGPVAQCLLLPQKHLQHTLGGLLHGHLIPQQGTPLNLPAVYEINQCFAGNHPKLLHIKGQ